MSPPFSGNFTMSYCMCVLLVILQGFHVKCGSEESIFRDRQGNSVRTVNNKAYFQKSGERDSLPILTQQNHKIIKMKGDSQRSYLFFLSGNVVGRVLNPYGNLYVMFTSDIRVCNQTVVTIELVDGYIINDFKIDHFLGSMELKMGNYGNIQIKRNLLAYMLSKLDFAKDTYYDDYFCLAENRRIFSGRYVMQEMTTRIPEVLPLTINYDVRNLPNNNNDDDNVDTIVEDIVKFHEMVMDNYALQVQNEEKGFPN
ncbi:uncharacterized protein LOC143918821 [Arctopsyche grandis]|uniref:uncharacterized protein LOC143918821 n=1 Tax=Arctopsyche grandis TaxID=121162 RepID=UPI00406D9690